MITLDADTRLPQGAAARLVGTMAHPLNRPRFSDREGRVVEGYAIVQPRITPSLPVDHPSSLSQRVFSGPGGIDPYSSAVSDVYQDLFQEGSYTGKGIYDIDAFEAALAGKAPENSLLSHDLFEGIFARVALATDIELFEEFPSRYEAVAARQHRWARGDWQLLPWLFGRGHIGARKTESRQDSNHRPLEDSRQPAPHSCQRLPHFSHWLRGGFCLLLLPGYGRYSFSRRLRFPRSCHFLSDSSRVEKAFPCEAIFAASLSDLALGACQIGLTLTFLAYQAWLMTDAILRTLGRLFITHRNLLEWVTAAQSKFSAESKFPAIYKRMAGGVVVAARLDCGSRVCDTTSAWVVAAPFLVLWVAAPAVALWISRLPTSSRGKSVAPCRRAGFPPNCAPDMAISSKPLFPKRTTRSLPTIFRKRPIPLSRTELRRQILGSIFFPRFARETSDG